LFTFWGAAESLDPDELKRSLLMPVASKKKKPAKKKAAKKVAKRKTKKKSKKK
jgi:hypothetical protein